MAERRMFSKSVVDSDAFSEMPLTTQALYFRLGMQADDDGFVNNPKLIQRMIGASEDDLKLLLAKGFLIAFPSGVVVVTHWRMQNRIRSDRYKATSYQTEIHSLMIQDGLYILQSGSTGGLHTDGIPNGNQMDTQYSIGKSSIDKYIPPIAPQGADARQKQTAEQGESLPVKTGCAARQSGDLANSSHTQALQERKRLASGHCSGAAKKAVGHSKTLVLQRFDVFWQAYPKKVAKKAAQKAFCKLNPDETLLETILQAVKRAKNSEQWKKDNGQYIPNPATWLNQGRWEDETPEQAQKGGDLPWF